MASVRSAILCAVTYDSSLDLADALERRWRTGRKVGRTIYVVVGEEPSDDDVLIGVMDTPELADEAVRAHNLDI